MSFQPIFKIDDYEKLLKYIKNNNFIVTNFHNLFKSYKSSHEIPSKFVLMRHDIHHRDIDNAYKMIELENKYFGENIATYFVQWNFIGTNLYEENEEKNNKKDYETFIHYCIKNKVDVQPHISLFSYSFNKIYNRNEDNINIINDDSINLVIKNTTRTIINDTINEQTYNTPTSYVYIENKNSKMVKEIDLFFQTVKQFLINYMNEWESKFKIKPTCYSCHGDGIKLTQKFNPNYFASLKELDDIFVNANSVYMFLGNNSLYKLYYKSDNSLNKEKIEDYLYKNTNNQYELLIHPYVWQLT
jgi:hypothetical protein